jgi:hypothetical protein
MQHGRTLCDGLSGRQGEATAAELRFTLWRRVDTMRA